MKKVGMFSMIFMMCPIFLFTQEKSLRVDSSQLPPAETFVFKNKYNQIGVSGLLQVQFQAAFSKGIQNYNGGNFAPNSNNRFMIRRSRAKIDFKSFTKGHKLWNQWVFQVDATERGVSVRDAYAILYENKWDLFNVTAGLTFRPFGHELVYSSTKRESPERGRMSEVLFRNGRDIGAILTINDRKKSSKYKNFSAKIGIFNGPGLAGSREFDSYKDFVFRLENKKIKLSNTGIYFSAGLSALLGGVNNINPLYYYHKGNVLFADSNSANIGKILKKQYFGGDLQLVIPNQKGVTEIRMEYISGKQVGTLSSTNTFGDYPLLANGNNAPLAIRNFNGAYFYFLQNLNSEKHQIVLKYDWYNPNTAVKSSEIGSGGNLTAADLAFQTLSAGYNFYIHPNAKLSLWYDHPINKSTKLTGYQKDLNDDVFTCRLQINF
ncbi:MAG TPA: porin [Edaphocola sp.]|nr:porin [Edaphocola sp.]